MDIEAQRVWPSNPSTRFLTLSDKSVESLGRVPVKISIDCNIPKRVPPQKPAWIVRLLVHPMVQILCGDSENVTRLHGGG